MSFASHVPPPDAVDAALIVARNSALTAAQTATGALNSAVSQTGSNSSPAGKIAADILSALLHQVKDITDVDTDSNLPANVSASSSGYCSTIASAAPATPALAAQSGHFDLLATVLTRVDDITCSNTTDMFLTALFPLIDNGFCRRQRSSQPEQDTTQSQRG